MSLLQLPPLSLYVHIPWCIKKCPYCDFNSHETNTIPEQAYCDALVQDLKNEQALTQGRKLRSIFFGGGTPSLFSAAAIATILNSAEKIIGFEADIEITLEANPGTFEQQKFTDFFAAGINRLSIGIQSFQAQHLHKLGRIHSSDEAIACVTMATQAGFNNINIDLMHGLPEQTVQQALTDINTAIALAPQHISWYQLTLEPNTVFYKQPPPLPSDNKLADIQEAGQQQLTQAGYRHYEISAFSQQQYPSQHNLNYWQFGDYLGIGAGACGKITDLQHAQIIRRQKTRLPQHYLNGKPIANSKTVIIDDTERPLEFMMNALRLNQGVPTAYFEQRTGIKLTAITAICDRLRRRQLLQNHDHTISATALGRRFLNTLLAEFMPSTPTITLHTQED